MSVLPPSSSILITGASRGIGVAIATQLARPDVTLHLVSRRKEDLEDVAAQVCEKGAEVYTYSVDLASVESLSGFLKEIKNHGFAIDMVVNNAGILGPECFPWEAEIDEWWETQLVNVRAPFIIDRELIPLMLTRGGGRIIDTSSGAAVLDDPLYSSYFVSKTALMRLGGCLHEAGRDYGLKVFEVAPGVVKTDFTKRMIMHEGRTRWNSPTEISQIIEAIALGKLDGLSGTQLRVGVDTLPDLMQRSERGVDQNECKLRLSPWAK
ncbi:SDR family NAD(P)-dependent oxidoreductase [Arcanobacterium ihumii]|uniref:SDR family NAD(P)-dependent oxidoreductase n=1 Tax=Arcanobacterium ihumii TaxID=2138162 RepID=UPI000F51F31F|nr:SDR family oxidoreductase [Arcanobacterium ihumii]